MAKKMPIATFVSELQATVKRKDGYIMGAKGENPQKWSKTNWKFTQYKDRKKYSAEQEQKALYWREHAERVWDCNGLAEGLYQDYAGVNINTYARTNYSNWCSKKGVGMIPVEYRVPGAAVYWGKKAADITHVAYLEKPVVANEPDGDWYIIEARGVMYGCVRTKLYSRKPAYWGWMTKYFDYGVNAGEVTPTTLRKGDKGTAVKELQTDLIALGYDCGSYGADGDFGSATEKAVRKFQTDHGLTVDGVVGAATHAALLKAKANTVTIVNGNCNVRPTPDTTGKSFGVARKGETYRYLGETAANGWNKIEFKGKQGWVSGKYSEVTPVG